MSQRATRPTKSVAADGARAPIQRIGSAMHSAGFTERIAAPRTMEEVEQRYVASRDAWVAAMRAANSGRPADMATLAICQEAYEAATLERERWLSGARVAIPVEPAKEHASIEAVVDQALAWQEVHEHEKPRGFLGRLFRRRPKD
jgi:hypothetical protein